MSIRRLKVFRKTEDLLYKVYPALVNYPKQDKFALVNDIRITFFKLLSFISQANSVKSKRKIYLQEADGHLQVLKIQIKLSKQRRYISESLVEREFELFFCASPELGMIIKIKVLVA
jgi:hypothetical protein